MDTWIHAMVRSRCRRRLVAWTIALVGVALFASGERRYIRNFFMGPYELSAADLDAITDASDSPRYFVRVTGTKALDTGLQEITIRKRHGVETGRSVSAGYYALVVGSRLLVCKSGAGRRTTYEGELTPMPMDLRKRLFDTPETQALRARFHPYYVDSDSFRLPGYVAIVGLIVFGFLLVKHGLGAWTHLRNPETHPVIARVERWGDPIGVAVAAETEARTPRYRGAKGWAVTDQYLVQSTFFTFELLRLSELLWAYKKVTKHSVNFIPTGKTYEAVLFCQGGGATIAGKEKTIDGVLEFAARRSPWAIFGFSTELQQHFRKNAEAFRAAVEGRRRELAATRG